MVSLTDTSRPNGEDTVTVRKPAAAKQQPAAPTSSTVDRPVTIYYIAWRLKPSHPWRSEEFYTRLDAHCEYFDRLKRGMEVYLEVRCRSVPS